jgi:1,4-dihydroxy-2-naphthoate octaprenyltransferase
MGIVMVSGSYFVHTGDLTLASVLLAVPIGLLVAATLHANNIRDMESDAAAGKRTLANVVGRGFANREYAAQVYGAFVAVILLVLTDASLWPVLIVYTTLPAAARLVSMVFDESSGVDLNRVLRKTAGLHLRFGLMLSVALLFRSILDRAL